jgi:threonyl-tRNA synthetase
VFNELFTAYQSELLLIPDEDITITLPDGTIKTGLAHKTTPYDIAKGISQVFRNINARNKTCSC